MRILALIAATAFVLGSAAAQAEPRSLSLSGVDQKLPGSLGKAAEVPKIAEAPKPPDPPKPPEPKAAQAAPAAAPAPPAATAAPAAEPPKETPAFVQRPSIGGAKPVENKAGQVTFDETKPAPAAPAATTEPEKTKQAKADKPKRKRAHWDEARIMREIYRYSGYAGMIGGW